MPAALLGRLMLGRLMLGMPAGTAALLMQAGSLGQLMLAEAPAASRRLMLVMLPGTVVLPMPAASLGRLMLGMLGG